MRGPAGTRRPRHHNYVAVLLLLLHLARDVRRNFANLEPDLQCALELADLGPLRARAERRSKPRARHVSTGELACLERERRADGPSHERRQATERTFVIRVRNGRAEWVDARPVEASGDQIEVVGPLSPGDLVLRCGTTRSARARRSR